MTDKPLKAIKAGSEQLSYDDIAMLCDRVDEIRHGIDQIDHAHALLNLARADARHNRLRRERFEQGNSNISFKGSPLPLVVIIGPTGAAKSHIIKTYHERFSLKENWPPNIRHVVDLELSVDANKRQLQSDILTALRDSDPESGNESKLRRRVRIQTRALQTDLMLIDEVQHFIGSDTGKRANGVIDSLKKHLNSGISALGIFGTENAEKIFGKGTEFGQRGVGYISLEGLRDTAQGRQAFRDFLRTFRIGIEEKGILQNAKMFETDEFAGCLFEQVWGRYGTAQRLMKIAIRIALMRGGTALLPRDFAIAVATSQKLYQFDGNVFADRAASFE